MRTQLRHMSLPLVGASELLFAMAVVGLLLLAFLAYTVYTIRQENGYWVVVRRRAKKEKADEDLLAQDPLVKKGVDLEGGKRRQYVVEDLYRFKTITPSHDAQLHFLELSSLPLPSKGGEGHEELMRQGLGRY